MEDVKKLIASQNELIAEQNTILKALILTIAERHALSGTDAVSLETPRSTLLYDGKCTEYACQTLSDMLLRARGVSDEHVSGE